MLFSKVDVILKPFINLHFNHSFGKFLKKVFKVVSIPLEETKNQPNGFLRFVHRLFIITLGVILCLIASPLYLVVYLGVAIVTISLSVFIVLGIGLLYGLFPFLLPATSYENIDQTFETKEYKGYNKLLEPISWSGILFDKVGRYLFNLGNRPANRIKELESVDYQTHILDRIGLGIATPISFIIYSLLTCGIVQVGTNVFIFIIVAVSTILWMIIYVFDTLIKSLFSNKEDE